MNFDKNFFSKLLLLSGAEYLLKRVIIAVIMTALPFTAPGQTTRKKTARNSLNVVDSGSRKIAAQQLNSIRQQPIVPRADHHTHLWSLNASTLVTEPLLPIVELPEDLKRLLQDKERFSGKDKNPTALADLYTKDALVLNPTSPAWLRGERAISYATNNTITPRLLPTAYEVEGSSGYIAGYEAEVEGASTYYLSNFLYVIKKGTDGKWRISSEAFTLKGPPVPKAITADKLMRPLRNNTTLS